MAAMPNLPKIALSRSQVIIIAAGLALTAIVVLLFSLGGNSGTDLPPVTIKVWGLDTKENFEPIVSGYQTLRPNATIEYTQVPASNYDQSLLNALASGNGPDVFAIGNHDLLVRGALLAPAPETQVTLPDVQSSFPQAVVQDFAWNGRIYALPLYMDTLALFYNKQMLDQAGIALPPDTWQKVVDGVSLLRAQDQSGQITRAAIAVGGTEKSVKYGTDILNMIMLQNGAPMADDAGVPRFTRDNAAAQALQFYLQFADTGSPAYTWNDAQGLSMESFAALKTAMVFAYHEDVADLRAKAPFLDFGIAPVPQISPDRAVAYPKYRGLGVWTGSTVQGWAWDFVIFASTDLDAQRSYLAATGRSPALRTLISEQSRDPELGVFARSALIARSWKMGDYDRIKAIFNTAIQNVLTGAKAPAAALREAEAQATQLISN